MPYCSIISYTHCAIRNLSGPDPLSLRQETILQPRSAARNDIVCLSTNRAQLRHWCSDAYFSVLSVRLWCGCSAYWPPHKQTTSSSLSPETHCPSKQPVYLITNGQIHIHVIIAHLALSPVHLHSLTCTRLTAVSRLPVACMGVGRFTSLLPADAFMSSAAAHQLARQSQLSGEGSYIKQAHVLFIARLLAASRSPQ